MFSRSQRRTTEQGEFSPATTRPHTHHRDTTTPTGTQPSPVGPRQRAPPGARASTRYKTLPATAAPGPNRYKTLPAPPTTGPNRYKTLPARPQSTKSGHFSRAGRIFSRSHHHATEQGEFSPASNTNPPLTRYKTLPATPTTGPNRYKTLPALPQSPKSGHFSRAGRIFSRSQRRVTEQGEFSPATTPSWRLFQRS